MNLFQKIKHLYYIKILKFKYAGEFWHPDGYYHGYFKKINGEYYYTNIKVKYKKNNKNN